MGRAKLQGQRGEIGFSLKVTIRSLPATRRLFVSTLWTVSVMPFFLFFCHDNLSASISAETCQCLELPLSPPVRCKNNFPDSEKQREEKKKNYCELGVGLPFLPLVIYSPYNKARKRHLHIFNSVSWARKTQCRWVRNSETQKLNVPRCLPGWMNLTLTPVESQWAWNPKSGLLLGLSVRLTLISLWST